MKNVFIDYAKAIEDIAKENKVDYSVGLSMFVTNCQNYRARQEEKYKGAIGANYKMLHDIYMNIPVSLWTGMQKDYIFYINKKMAAGKAEEAKAAAAYEKAKRETELLAEKESRARRAAAVEAEKAEAKMVPVEKAEKKG